MPINIKSSESSGVIIIEDKKKAKSEAKKQISQTYMEPKLKPPPPIIPKPQQIKVIIDDGKGNLRLIDLFRSVLMVRWKEVRWGLEK